MKRLALFAALPMLLAAGAYDAPEAYSKSDRIRSGVVRLPELAGGGAYSLLFSVSGLEKLGASARIAVKLRAGQKVLIEKVLHAGDPDLYAHFHLDAASAPELIIDANPQGGGYALQVNRLPDSPSLQRGGNHTWRQASPMILGRTVFASADEIEYIPLPSTPRSAILSPAGEDWYRFEFNSPQPKLVFFQLELTDRDDLPVDIAVFRIEDGKPVEYTEGQDPVSNPHEVQALAGNKFTPRLLRQSGTYYVRVRANHPEYKLRTRLYDVPPYSDPRQAVRTAVDYIMGAGDSWFANTPRRGGILDRVSNVHQETSLCVGCHPSQFSQRAQLYAAANGYPVVQRQQLQFLTDRFYNNPRPFYGFEDQGAVWARVISAPANVLSRMSVLMNLFENQVSLEPRPQYHQGIAKYLDLYYAGKYKLPPDETNGNKPLVSAYEVAWYSWKLTHNPELPGMIAAGDVKNMIDLCYQTQALADIDAVRYRDHIRKNAERILSLQRPDGQWSMEFDPSQPEVEFQTGHALWALAAAGIPLDHPQVQKGLAYLMRRQQPFGGWMDPLQSFENFKTPFRETQFAVLALSAYYPLPGRKPGWDSPPPLALSSNPAELLEQLDQVWDRPSPAVIAQIESAARSNDALIRQAAAEALGRLALPKERDLFVKLLGDPSKLVQRTAAWSLRRLYAAHPDLGSEPLLAALSSPDSRTRWGATRVFAHHFAALARRNEVAQALLQRVADPALTVRLQAIKGLWQAWFWNADPAVRGAIEDAILAALAEPQHPWIEANLKDAVYNLADENIRYLYNNWVPLLGREADRERAIRGRLTVESQLASKIAAALEHGPARQQKLLLAALAEFPLRRADAYELDADLSKPAPLVYSRIGNDIEQIAFFGPSADKLSAAILQLLDSQDPELRRLAARASLIVRETPYAAVDRAAGDRGENTKALRARLASTPGDEEIAKAFHDSPAGRNTVKTAAYGAARETPNATLDERYFRLYVEPILHQKGPDGYACADCHATHTLFNATWSTVKNVVNTKDPKNSLILLKPTSTAQSEGVVGATSTAHGGGRRWPKGSPEYETILRWIEGARAAN
jgi:hypothetical protein